MPSINVTNNPNPAIALVNKVIHAAVQLNPTVSGSLPPVQFAQQLRTHFPTIEHSVEKPNGFFELDLGNLRMMWVACYDQFGSCVIFFVTHCEPVYGAEVMVNFIDELRGACARADFEFGALNGPMYEAEPDVCRILAQGNVV